MKSMKNFLPRSRKSFNTKPRFSPLPFSTYSLLIDREAVFFAVFFLLLSRFALCVYPEATGPPLDISPRPRYARTLIIGGAVPLGGAAPQRIWAAIKPRKEP
jgi:hypothetical protein